MCKVSIVINDGCIKFYNFIATRETHLNLLRHKLMTGLPVVKENLKFIKHKSF